MAGMFIARSALFHFSKSLPQASSITLGSSHKTSTLVFASASNYSDWRNAAEGRRESRTDWGYDPSKARLEAEERGRDMGERAKETMSRGVDEAKEYGHEAKEKTKDMAGTVADRAKEGTNRAGEWAHETKEEAKGAAGSMADKTKEYAHDAKEKVKEGAQRAGETAGYVKERTKENASGAAEKTADAAETATEKVGKAVEGAWGAAKDTTQKIKETKVLALFVPHGKQSNIFQSLRILLIILSSFRAMKEWSKNGGGGLMQGAGLSEAKSWPVSRQNELNGDVPLLFRR
ncbi:desiccation-related protein PCC3-06-like isoform X2 [Senna tora]|uniref:Desiccation-related protein PCC3-06-like isoform X2 n=1 Tax=Senna tora TaxID=362788 RepID=A0A834W5M9_9FABA|nr:desiccation-related protein PCC3-06-like isoform X2 [Senna tora]